MDKKVLEFENILETFAHFLSLIKTVPELRRKHDGVHWEGLLAQLLIGLIRRCTRRRIFIVGYVACNGGGGGGVLDLEAVQIGVDSFRVAYVLQHHFALMQGGVAESELEQLQVPDFLIGVVSEMRQQTVGEQGPVLVDKELFGAVYVDEHGYDIGSPTRGRGFGRISIDWVGHPVIPTISHLTGYK